MEKIGAWILLQEMVACFWNANKWAVQHCVHPAKRLMEEASVARPSPRHVQGEQGAELSTVFAMVDHAVHEHDVCLCELGPE